MAFLSFLPAIANVVGGLFGGGGRGGSSGTPEQSLGRETAQRVLGTLEPNINKIQNLRLAQPALSLTDLLGATGGGGQLLEAIRGARQGGAATQATASAAARGIFPSLLQEFLSERKLQQQALLAQRAQAAQEQAVIQGTLASLIGSLLSTPTSTGGGGGSNPFAALGTIAGLLGGGGSKGGVKTGTRIAQETPVIALGEAGPRA